MAYSTSSCTAVVATATRSLSLPAHAAFATRAGAPRWTPHGRAPIASPLLGACAPTRAGGTLLTPATSLGGVTAATTALSLPHSPALACTNLMCEHVGKGCACRLALALERARGLTRLDISGNQLPLLPPSLRTLSSLTHLDLSGNALTQLGDVSALVQLQVLSVRGNPRLTLDGLAGVAVLPHLRSVDVRGTRITQSEAAGLFANRAVPVEVVAEG